MIGLVVQITSIQCKPMFICQFKGPSQKPVSHLGPKKGGVYFEGLVNYQKVCSQPLYSLHPGTVNFPVRPSPPPPKPRLRICEVRRLVATPVYREGAYEEKNVGA
jgi:hypothetical protein